MPGVGLRKLCPLDSFGCAFREKKAVRKSTPGGGKTGPRGVQNGLWKASAWDAIGALGAVLGASWGVPGRSWASFWDPPRADLDDLDVVCGAT